MENIEIVRYINKNFSSFNNNFELRKIIIKHNLTIFDIASILEVEPVQVARWIKLRDPERDFFPSEYLTILKRIYN